MQESNKDRKIKKIIYIIIVIVLIWLSFGAGLYFSGEGRVLEDLADEEVVFLGSVTGKYQDESDGRMSQDIDFAQFWDVWDMIYST